MIRACILISMAAAAPLLAQPNGTPKQTETIPVALAVQDLSDAYGTAPTADEITARVRVPGLERIEVLVVRIEPEPEGDGLRRVLLELGQLRAYFGEGELLVTSTAAADRFYHASYDGPLSSATIEELLPPVPAPQLALAAGVRAHEPVDLTPYTRGVMLSSAVAQTRLRQPVMVIGGAGASGPVTLIADVQTSRLARFAADISTPEGSLSLDLACRPMEPGDPSLWRPQVESRQQVQALWDLRPRPQPATLLQVGDEVPDLMFSASDLQPWSLASALKADPGKPVAIVIWRWEADVQRRQVAMRDALAAARALSSIEARGAAPPFRAVAATAMELSDYSRITFAETVSAWAAEVNGSAQRPPKGVEMLLWTSSPARSIERFGAGASAVAVVIAPNRTLHAVVPLDGRAEDPELVQALTTALQPPPEPTPAESPPPAEGP